MYYCDKSLLKLVPYIVFYYNKQYNNLIKNDKWYIKELSIKTYSRSSTILPFFYRCIFRVHNGKRFINVNITKEKFFYKLGEFSFSKISARHNKKKKKGR